MKKTNTKIDVFVKPNFLIAGCQKSGTTWLHNALSKSPKIFGSKVKELNYFNKPRRQDLREQYFSNFPKTQGTTYYLESTPHYFQKPENGNDTAKNIIDEIGIPKIIIIFRNPVARYESAYIHHMMQGRIPYSRYINQLTNKEKMLSLGEYSEIAMHWSSIFSNIKYMLYDDLVEDPEAFTLDAFNYLDLDYDLTRDDLTFRTNDKERKIQEMSLKWDKMPRITVSLKNRLIEHYRDEVSNLENILHRDLSRWRTEEK